LVINMGAGTTIPNNWSRAPLAGAENLSILWSLEEDVLSHLGHTSSRLLAECAQHDPVSLEVVAMAHGKAMMDRGAATGIEYAGSDMAWAHRLLEPIQRILTVWRPRVEVLKNCKANVSLPKSPGGTVEVDLLHADGVVELKLRTGDKKAKQAARGQVLAHAAAARQAGLTVSSAEVWYLIEGFVDSMQEEFA
jgi:hypothetical protein